MLKFYFAALSLAVLLVTFGGSSSMAKSYRWSCVYIQYASPDGLAPVSFQLEFVHDDITKRTVIIGNQGIGDVEFHVGPLGVTFIEKLEGGVVQTTTVANDGRSVHSRHTIFGTNLAPSQYYGHCKVR